MAVGNIATQGVATAIGKDTAQLFLCAHNPEGTGIFNDFFLKTSKVANIMNIGEILQQYQAVQVNVLDQDSYNLQGPKEPTTFDLTLAVVKGQSSVITEWWKTRARLDWGIAFFDVTGAVILAFGGTANLASATISGAEAGNIVQFQCQLNAETMDDFSESEITSGGVTPAGG